jgi:hypothetical protein
VSGRSTNFAATHFIITSSVKMRWHEFYNTLLQKFRQWSDVDLQGQSGEPFKHFHQFCSWYGGYNAVDLQQTFQLT